MEEVGAERGVGVGAVDMVRSTGGAEREEEEGGGDSWDDGSG